MDSTSNILCLQRYAPKGEKKSYSHIGYPNLPNKNITLDQVHAGWNELVRMVVSIKLGYTTASKLFKGLNSYTSNRNSLKNALTAYGQIVKTIYILDYIDNLELRQIIHKRFNRGERGNRLDRASAIGSSGLKYAEKEEQIYEAANQVAKTNFKKLSDSLPLKLEQKEAKLAKRLSKPKMPTLKKLRKLYEFMDELYSYVETFTPCAKGFNYCCTYPVTVSEIEIQNIEINTGIKRKAIVVKQDRDNFTPCPFLKNGDCSVYGARPFVCRRHVTMTETNKWCKPENAFGYSFPLLSLTEVNRSYDFIRAESSKSSSVDIRHAF